MLRVTVDVQHPEKAAAALIGRVLSARTTAIFRSVALGNIVIMNQIWTNLRKVNLGISELI